MPIDSPSPSEVLAARVVELRKRHGWSQAELADRMSSYGLGWGPTTVTKVEKGDRQVSVDEFVALAYVLGVSPAALVTPTAYRAGLAVTPNTTLAGPTVWRWFCGTFPTGAVPYGGFLSFDEGEARTRFYDEACPDYIATAERRLPGLLHLMQTVSGAQSGAGLPEDLWVSKKALPSMPDRVADALADAHETTASLLRKARRLLAQKGAQT